MRRVPACALLFALTGACGAPRDRSVQHDAATQQDDAAVPDAAPLEPPPSSCTLGGLTTLSGLPDMDSRLETDGRYVYFISGHRLERAPIDGGASEVLVESAGDFALIGERLFIAPPIGGIAERASSGELEALVDEPFPQRIEASNDRIYFCGGDAVEVTGSEPFYMFDIARSELAMHTTSLNRIGCVKALRDGAYWIERGSSDSPPTRVMRMRQGQGVDTIIDYAAGFGSAVVDERSYALRVDDGIVLGARASDERVELPVENANDLRFVGEHLYFNGTRQCTPMPNFGNGSPGCTDDVMRVVRDGGAVETLVEAPAEVGAMAADEACVYWVGIHTPCHPGCTTSLMAAPLPVR